MYCGNCGKKNPDGSKYCICCGGKLIQVDEFNIDNNEFDYYGNQKEKINSTTKQKSKSYRFYSKKDVKDCKFLCLFIIFFCIFLAVMFYVTTGYSGLPLAFHSIPLIPIIAYIGFVFYTIHVSKTAKKYENCFLKGTSSKGVIVDLKQVNSRNQNEIQNCVSFEYIIDGVLYKTIKQVISFDAFSKLSIGSNVDILVYENFAVLDVNKI